MPDRYFRAYRILPDTPITIEVRCRDGSTAVVHGRVDSVPHLAGEVAQRVVVVDAVAEPGAGP